MLTMTEGRSVEAEALQVRLHTIGPGIMLNSIIVQTYKALMGTRFGWTPPEVILCCVTSLYTYMGGSQSRPVTMLAGAEPQC